MEKKILLPNSVHTRRKQENSKKIPKKLKIIKKPLSDIIFSQNGMRQDEKVGKKFYSRMPYILDPGKKIPKKKSKKIEKIKKTSFQHYFLPKRDEIGREREKKIKILLPNSVHARPRQNGMRQAEMEKKKNFTPKFRSYSTQVRKFQKNTKKIENN